MLEEVNTLEKIIPEEGQCVAIIWDTGRCVAYYCDGGFYKLEYDPNLGILRKVFVNENVVRWANLNLNDPR